MHYSVVFFSALLWISMGGLLIAFGFQIWYNIEDFKAKVLW